MTMLTGHLMHIQRVAMSEATSAMPHAPVVEHVDVRQTRTAWSRLTRRQRPSRVVAPTA